GGDISFDEVVSRQRIAEYGTDDPGLMERGKGAQASGATLAAARGLLEPPGEDGEGKRLGFGQKRKRGRAANAQKETAARAAADEADRNSREEEETRRAPLPSGPMPRR